MSTITRVTTYRQKKIKIAEQTYLRVLPDKYPTFVKLLPCTMNYTAKYTKNNPRERTAMFLFWKIVRAYIECMVESLLDGNTIFMSSGSLIKLTLLNGGAKPYDSLEERTKKAKLVFTVFDRERGYYRSKSYLSEKMRDMIKLSLSKGLQLPKKHDNARKY